MRRRAPWLAWIAIVGTFAAGPLLRGTAVDDGEGSAAAYTAFVLAFATTGALTASRRPRNPIGWILLGAGLSYALGGLSVALVEDGSAPAFVAWLGSWVWMAGIGPVATFGLLLFPDGRLPSRRWRPVAWLAAAANLLTVAGIALTPGRLEDLAVDNPVGLDVAPGVATALASAGGVGLAVAVAASIASLFARFRRARSVERQQLKWLTYAAALVGVGLAAALVVTEAVAGPAGVNLSNTIVTLSVAMVPVAMGIAILRHRLYDIDVVINRTLVYGALTATLGATYLALVLPAGLAVGESNVTIAASTLAVAALFRPARARIQAAVDRRFYRRRYDAGRTLQAFGARLRDEVDLDTIGADLRAAAHDSLQPAHVSLWLRRTT